jgi:hypothetical protein
MGMKKTKERILLGVNLGIYINIFLEALIKTILIVR